MTNDEINKPRAFEIFYSGLAGTLSVRTNYSAFIMMTQKTKDDEYIRVIELAPMLKMMEARESLLEEVQNYLYWNADNLCGDDCIGDQKFTKRFKEVISKINAELKSYRTFKRENGFSEL